MRARKKAEVRQRIVSAALDLFSREGIEGTTIESITQAAGVAKGTFFNYFDSKSALLADYYGRFVADVHTYGERLPTSPARRWFERLYGRLARVVGGAPLLARIVLGEHGHPVIRELEGRSWEQGRERMLQVLEEGQRAGELDPRLDPELAAKLLSAIWTATLIEWIAAEPTFSLEREVRRRQRVMWEGLLVR